MYPAARFIIPQSHLEDLGRQGVGLLFGVPGSDGRKNQDALANGRHQLLLDGDGGGYNPLEDGCGSLREKLSGSMQSATREGPTNLSSWAADQKRKKGEPRK